jgi:SAM-dependent methyltransferase
VSAEHRDETRIAYTECPICGADEPRFLRDQDWSWRPDYQPTLTPIIRWMYCGQCGHQHTWGYHNDAALREVFAGTQAGQTVHGLTGSDLEASRSVWVKMVDRVTQRVSRGDWLDVGAGDGMLLATARECGFSTVAIEARRSTAEALRTRGIDVIASDVSELGAVDEARFDVISFCDVLEHMPFPLTALQMASRALRDGGVLVASSPNRDALAWQVLDEEGINPYWSEIEHYHNFSYRQLREILEMHGFGEVSCSVSNRYRLGMDVVATRSRR